MQLTPTVPIAELRIEIVAGLSQFIRELRRRHVFRTGAAYLVAAWLLMQVAEILLGTFDTPGWLMRGIVIVLAIGFPIAIILAWIYDITSHGIKRSTEVDEEEPTSAPDARKIDFVIIGVLLVAVTLFAADKFRWIEFGSQSAPDHRSIAVLPFTFLGPDSGSEYFADAITDELIGRLGRIDAVQIKSRLSVARFKETDQGIDEIAAELGVSHILEGSVRKAEDRVRVTAQLTDASSGFEEWSDVFDGESNDWFTLHEEMAVRIADALNLHISPEEVDAVRAHYTENPEAYDAFWRGWLLLESFHADVSQPEEKLRAAERHLKRALELDPDYPLAVAGLSLANSYYYFYGVDRSVERRERGIELARRALAIDPDLPEGHVALGVAFGVADDHASAVGEFEKALSRDSDNAMIWCLLAYSCIAQKPPDPVTAEEAARISIGNDPTWTYSYNLLGWALSLQGRYEEAADAYQIGAEFNPDFFDVQFGLGNTHLELGNFDQALSAFKAARRLDETGEVLVYTAAAHVGLGDIDQALAILKLGLDHGFTAIDAIEGSRYFTPLHDDPRFSTLVESHGKQAED